MSEIKNITTYNGYYVGVFTSTHEFFVVDMDFNMIYSTGAFDIEGNFTIGVKAIMRKGNIKQTDFRFRTDANLSAIKTNITNLLKLQAKIKK